jgi:RNA polymerase sigma factor (sigma-70 family)
LLDEIRRFRGQKRDVAREQSLEQSLARSASRLNEWLASEQTSPSGKASANERAVALAHALSTLPAAQATAIELHFLQGQSLKQVAANMSKTEGAVAALVFRGTRTLRERMNDPDEDES